MRSRSSMETSSNALPTTGRCATTGFAATPRAGTPAAMPMPAIKLLRFISPPCATARASPGRSGFESEAVLERHAELARAVRDTDRAVGGDAVEVAHEVVLVGDVLGEQRQLPVRIRRTPGQACVV